jgi:hypothetical protein
MSSDQLLFGPFLINSAGRLKSGIFIGNGLCDNVKSHQLRGMEHGRPTHPGGTVLNQ